jgi:CRISPR-associated endonuclease/helicase Cas3
MPEDLHPEITIIVPSTYGGISEGTWDPSSSEPVPDLGDQARWQQTRRATLRLHPAVHPELPSLPRPASEDEDAAGERERVRAWLDDVRPSDGAGAWLAKALAALRKGRRGPVIVRLEAQPSGGETSADAYLAVIARGAARDATTEDEGSSHTGVEVTLREHMIGVAGWARRFADGCGLPASIMGDVELAARWHDAGKVDPRFQRMLHGGSAYKTEVAREPLAKSAIVAADHAARRRAFEQSGYPRGARHELSSVALLQAGSSLLDGAADRDLVLHLVASHHGWCRPFAPAVADVEPVELALDTGASIVRVPSNHGLARLDSGVAERFWRLVERYGWFGLAWLEAILRLADHRRSEQEQQAKEAP